MADTTIEGQLQALAKSIAEWNIDLLIRPTNAGSYSFEELRDVFVAIKTFYNDLASAPLTLVPTSIWNEPLEFAKALIDSVSKVQGFDFKTYDPNQTRNQLIGRVQSDWRDAYNRTASHLTYIRVSSGTVAQELKGLRDMASAIKTEASAAANDYVSRANAAEQQLHNRLAELEKAIAAERESAKSAGVAAQAGEFDLEAQSARTTSWIWLAATIISVIVGLIVVQCIFLKDLPSSGAPSLSAQTTNRVALTAAIPAPASQATPDSKMITAAVLQQTIARILIVTLVYSVIVWCARNYFASRHNYTVNRHRRNAMQTFRAFVAGSEDKATQDFILRQAALCAFSPQQTGYLKDESLPTPAPASQIIDVVKSDSK